MPPQIPGKPEDQSEEPEAPEAPEAEEIEAEAEDLSAKLATLSVIEDDALFAKGLTNLLDELK